MSYISSQQKTGQIDRQQAPVATNQPRENLVRLYVIYYFKDFLFLF